MSSEYEERVQASAVQFLLEGGDRDAAMVLLPCELEIDDYYHNITIKAPRAAFDILRLIANDLGEDVSHKYRFQVFDALRSIAPDANGIFVQGQLISIDENWRAEMLDMARGKEVHNQALGANRVHHYQGQRFRSEGEISIAKVLEMTGVLYLANCRARLGLAENRHGKEPDFLICDSGKWGILEVDGQFHTPATRNSEQERDRLFHKHGIKVIHHYSWDRCIHDPLEVVQEFLELLKAS